MAITVDLTQLSGYSSLTAGTTYSITAVAKGTGNYTSSNKSNGASYTKSGSAGPTIGSLITINGGTTKYRVLGQVGGYYKLLDVSNATTAKFNDSTVTTTFSNNIAGQKYQDSVIDTAMTTYYNNLPTAVKNAIQAQAITQDMWYYGTSGSPVYQGEYEYVPSCFLPGTKITLADGTLKNVEDITYADTLKVWNFDTGMYDSASICWLTKDGLTNDHYWELTFSDGTTLRTTGRNSNHKIYNMDDRFFEGVAYVKIGTHVFTENGVVTVTDKQYVEAKCEYYNLMTTHRIDCFANGVLTSDRYGNMYSIDEDMKYIKDERVIRPYSEFAAVGISEYWYDVCRLGEQTESLDSTVNYIRKCEAQMRPLTAEEE